MTTARSQGQTRSVSGLMRHGRIAVAEEGVAEREGFEPPVRITVQRISRRGVSKGPNSSNSENAMQSALQRLPRLSQTNAALCHQGTVTARIRHSPERK